MLTLILVITALLALYYLLTKPYKYWPDRGVKQLKPYPIVGNNWKSFTRQENVSQVVLNAYNAGQKDRYCGMYQFFKPILLLRDADLIKQITVKDFDHFTDHGSFLPESDEMFSRSLFLLKNKAWKQMRANLSPAFTSAKMRTIFVLMRKASNQFVEFFQSSNPSNEVIELEMRDTFSRFTTDVIASTAFGVEVNSIKDRDNEFFRYGREASNFGSFRTIFKFMFSIALPKLSKLLGVKLFDDRIVDFFTNLVKDSIRQREEKGIVRPDMIHLLLEARKNLNKVEESSNSLPDTGFATVQESMAASPPKTPITDDDIVSQAFGFFLAGFDSVANAMCFTAHELAENPDVQDKLREEIREVVREANQVTYEELLKMKYLDMVVTESLRKYPVPLITDRVCIKPYTIQPKLPHERPLQLNVGDAVWLPMYGIHHDPEIYPNPSKFDPERFNDENKHKINLSHYLTFGIGPRACIGSRFALLEVKVLFFEILRHFEIVPIAKTNIPLKLSTTSMTFTSQDGFWLGLKPIEPIS